MQEEIENKTIALCIDTGKTAGRVTETVLKAAINQYLSSGEKTYRGEQTVGQLMRQNAELTSIEITDKNIKSFERVANKYDIDYALKKDKTVSPPRYYVFFKARDADVMTAAFKEYAQQELNTERKPSIIQKLQKALDLVRNRGDRQRERTRDREESL